MKRVYEKMANSFRFGRIPWCGVRYTRKELPLALSGGWCVFLRVGVAPAVKAEISMVHFGARQLAWSRALSVVSLVESVGDYPD